MICFTPTLKDIFSSKKPEKNIKIAKIDMKKVFKYRSFFSLLFKPISNRSNVKDGVFAKNLFQICDIDSN